MNREDLNEKLKDILQALNTENARQVLKGIEQFRSQVKKSQFYELLIEIASNSLVEKLCHLNQIILLQKKQIQNLQNYIQKIEIINVELCFRSISNLRNFSYKIFDKQNPELQNIILLTNQLQEQQTELFYNGLQQEKQMEIFANSNHENREFEKILIMVQSYIQKSEIILQAGKKFQFETEHQQTNNDVKEYIQALTNKIKKNYSFFIKLQETLNEQNLLKSLYAKQSLEIDEIYKKINQANIKREEKEQQNKIKQTLEQQGDEIINLQIKLIENQKSQLKKLETDQIQNVHLILTTITENDELVKKQKKLDEIKIKYDELIKKQQKLVEIEIKYDALTNRVQYDKKNQQRIIQNIENVIMKQERFLKSAKDKQQSCKYQETNYDLKELFNKFIFMIEININCLREVKIAWQQQFDCGQYSFGIDQKQEEIEDINQTNRVEREKFKQQLINMQQSLGQ